MNKPTCEQIFNEELELVTERADPSWRHGCNMTAVFKRDDGTFWEAKFQVSTDGETNGLRDGDARITQVFPKQITITVYEAKG